MYTHPLDGNLTESTAGAKAFHLGRLRQAGYPVPDGFVVTRNAFEDFFHEGASITGGFESELKAALDRVGASGYMVRSSAIGEDGIEASFAGQLESFESRPELQEIIENIKKCWLSYRKENVALYENTRGVKLKGMAVVVQQLIQPDLAGVIFTRNPESESEMLVEFVEGHGADLVSGKINPTRLTYGLNGHSVKMPMPPGLDGGIAIARKLEQLYQTPLDIEWAIQDEQFFLVQARPITTAAKGTKVHWSNTNINENYPDPVVPLLYSIARDSYYHYFRELSRLFLIRGEKIRELESSYSNIIGVFGCRMYYNMTSIHQIIAASPFSSMLAKSFDNFVGYAAAKAPQAPSRGSKLRFLGKVLRYHRSLDRTVREFESLADQYSERADVAIGFNDLRDSFHGFIEIRMRSWYKASLADFFAMLYHGVLGKFCKVFYREDAEGIHNKLIQAIPGLISSQPVVDMYSIRKELRADADAYSTFCALPADEFYKWLQQTDGHAAVREKINAYISRWGFRCSGELMLTTKTYCEEPERFVALLKQYDSMPDIDPEALIASRFNERKKVIRGFRKRILSRYGILFPLSLVQIGILHLLINLASKGIMARERVRLKQALLYFKFKQVIEKIGKAFQQRGLIDKGPDVLFLRYQEIAENLSSSDMLRIRLKERIATSKSEFIHASAVVYPDDFSTHLGEYPLPAGLNGHPVAVSGKLLKGLPVCGGQVRGKARVLASVLEAAKLEKGDILITRQTDPGWIVVFPLISGLIVERGGMLSHGAIVSREFGIPAVVGVENVCERIKDGDELMLNADTGEISIL